MGWAMADERKVTAPLRLVKASWRSGRKAAIKSVDDRVGSQDNRTERKAKQIRMLREWRIQKEYSRMKARHWGSRRLYWIFVAAVLPLPGLVLFASHRPGEENYQTASATGARQKKAPAGDALRLNTLGVAYLNQQKSAEAQKYFEQSLAADPDFAVAKMNLGIAFGAGYGDQGKFSLAEFLPGGETSVPAETAVRYEVAPLQKLMGVAGKSPADGG